MLHRDIELKILFFLGASFFLALLLMASERREKKRPMLLLFFYLVYLSLQCLRPIEFFPFTAFQMFSFPEEKAAFYFKLIAVRQDGSLVATPPQKVLPILVEGLTKRYLPHALKDSDFAKVFANVYVRAYNERFRKAGEPPISEIRIEQWKWDFLRDPYDSHLGFPVSRTMARPFQEMPDA